MTEKNSKHSDEIDLSEILINIWENKWKVFFTTSISTILMIGYLIIKNEEPIKLEFEGVTNINSISTCNELDYKNYNSYLEYNRPMSSSYTYKSEKENLVFEDWKLNYFENLSLKKIDKVYLLNLFVEKINDDVFFMNLLKKFKFINEDNYNSSEEYEKAISNLASSIKLLQVTSTNWRIQFKVVDKKKWENFLDFLEESTNLEVQNYLKKRFFKYVSNQNALKDFRMADLSDEISLAAENSDYAIWLKGQQKKLINSKNMERLTEFFKSTPVSNSNNFYAAKIISETTDYTKKYKKKKSKRALVMLAALLGAIFSILYVLITKNIRKY